MKLAGFNVNEEDIQLGRVTFNDNADYAKVSGYVLFYTRTTAENIPASICAKLQLAPEANVVVAVKAFRNNKGVVREALFFKASEINWDKTRNCEVGSSFKALCNTDWKYAVGEEGAEIFEEKEYRRFMLAKKNGTAIAV